MSKTVQGDCSTMTLPSDCTVELSNNMDLVWKDGKCLVSTKSADWWVWLLVGLGIAGIFAIAGFLLWKKKKVGQFFHI